MELRIRFISAFAVAVLCGAGLGAVQARGDEVPTFETHLRRSAVEKSVIDTSLDPKARAWAVFDPVTGYRLGNSMPRDGIGGSSTISTTRSDGARTGHVYADRPCRIHT